VIDRHRPRERHDAALAGGIGGDARLHGERLHRRDVDDRAAAATAHLRDAVLRRQIHAFEVHIEYLVPHLLRRIDDIAVAQHTGRVDEHIHAAVALDGEPDKRLDLRRRAHFGAAALNFEPFLAQLAHSFFDRRVVVAAEDDGRPTGAKPPRARTTDSERAAGHDGHLAGEVSHRRRSL
jgi:hypothetical protein